MEGKTLVKLLLLAMVLDLLMFSYTEGDPWRRRRRRRRRSIPPPPACSSSRPAGVSWMTNWQKYFALKCSKNGDSLKQWMSEHRNCKGDRIHYFKCRRGPMSYRKRHCSWYYANDYDQPMTFRCHYNGVITGVASWFKGSTNDRRFAFRCCHKRSYIQHSCKNTAYVNNWGQRLWYTVPYGYYLVGAHSYHDNSKKDRRWRFEICKFSRRCRRQG